MKRKASETFHGRRGGGYAEDGAGDHLHLLQQLRLREVRAGRWPKASLDEWRRRAAEGDPIGVAVTAAAKEAGPT